MNGEMLESVKKYLEGGVMPQEVTNVMIFSALMQVYAETRGHGDRISALEEANRLRETEKKDVVTKTSILKEIGLPIFNLIVALVVGYIFAVLTKGTP